MEVRMKNITRMKPPILGTFCSPRKLKHIINYVYQSIMSLGCESILTNAHHSYWLKKWKYTKKKVKIKKHLTINVTNSSISMLQEVQGNIPEMLLSDQNRCTRLRIIQLTCSVSRPNVLKILLSGILIECSFNNLTKLVSECSIN